MITVSKKFTPLVEACPIWIIHDVIFFQEAKFAHPSCWIVWRCTTNLTPNNSVRNVSWVCFSFFQMCWLRQVWLTSGSSNDSLCCLCLCLNSTVQPVWVSEVPVSCLVMVALYTRLVIVHLSGRPQFCLSFGWQLHLILNALPGCFFSRCSPVYVFNIYIKK